MNSVKFALLLSTASAISLNKATAAPPTTAKTLPDDDPKGYKVIIDLPDYPAQKHDYSGHDNPHNHYGYGYGGYGYGNGTGYGNGHPGYPGYGGYGGYGYSHGKNYDAYPNGYNHGYNKTVEPWPAYGGYGYGGYNGTGYPGYPGGYNGTGYNGTGFNYTYPTHYVPHGMDGDEDLGFKDIRVGGDIVSYAAKSRE